MSGESDLAEAMVLLAKEMRGLRDEVKGLRTDLQAVKPLTANMALFNKILMAVQREEGTAAMVARLLSGFGRMAKKMG